MNRMSDRWCFTINNPGDYTPPWPMRDALYLIYEMEHDGENENVAPGTPHWQGYVRFEARKRGSTVKNIFGYDGMYLTPANGDETSNQTYCSKEGHAHEFGAFDASAGARANQGARTDLEVIRDEIVGGAGLRELAMNHPAQLVRYINGLAQMVELIGPVAPVQRAVAARVYWGSTGMGKTHRIMTEYPEAYQVEPGRDPWGRYRGQKVVVFDEYDYSKWTIQQMNRFLDKWRCPLDARYRDRYAEWTLVVICANSSPLTWWPDSDWMLTLSFRRRIQGSVYRFTTQTQTLDDAQDITCDNLVP